MKKYNVVFIETYTYEKEIEVEDTEDIEEVIRDPLECPTVRDMSDDEYSNLNPDVCFDYDVEEK